MSDHDEPKVDLVTTSVRTSRSIDDPAPDEEMARFREQLATLLPGLVFIVRRATERSRGRAHYNRGALVARGCVGAVEVVIAGHVAPSWSVGVKHGENDSVEAALLYVRAVLHSTYRALDGLLIPQKLYVRGDVTDDQIESFVEQLKEATKGKAFNLVPFDDGDAEAALVDAARDLVGLSIPLGHNPHGFRIVHKDDVEDTGCQCEGCTCDPAAPHPYMPDGSGEYCACCGSGSTDTLHDDPDDDDDEEPPPPMTLESLDRMKTELGEPGSHNIRDEDAMSFGFRALPPQDAAFKPRVLLEAPRPTDAELHAFFDGLESEALKHAVADKRSVCLRSAPMVAGAPGRWIHPLAVEAGSGSDDTATYCCPVCGKTWTEELPQ